MPIHKSFASTSFDRGAFPGFPCPHCVNGKLRLIDGSLTVEEPEFSRRMYKHQDWEPDWAEERFVARMRCDEADCGEIVGMMGDVDIAEVYLDQEEDGYEGPALVALLQPRGMFPPPPFFPLEKSIPQEIRNQLQLAFGLYWQDLSACVARLRTAVEIMLDEQKVPRKQVNQKTGASDLINLHNRIVLFGKQSTGTDAMDSLHALRNIGNLGTHGGEVNREALFDAVDVIEDVLLGVYQKKSIKAKVKKLNDKKGDYSS